MPFVGSPPGCGGGSAPHSSGGNVHKFCANYSEPPVMTAGRYRCACPCNEIGWGGRLPNRRIECPACFYHVGPGCCWCYETGRCHRCSLDALDQTVTEGIPSVVSNTFGREVEKVACASATMGSAADTLRELTQSLRGYGQRRRYSSRAYPALRSGGSGEQPYAELPE